MLKKQRLLLRLIQITPVIGVIPRNDSMKNLNETPCLIPALEGRRRVADFDVNLGRIKEIIKEGIDIDRFISIANSASTALKKPHENIFKPQHRQGMIKIGVALDEAFNFYYRDNLELLEACGERNLFISVP